MIYRSEERVWGNNKFNEHSKRGNEKERERKGNKFA
jgi:hypothetical protein